MDESSEYITRFRERVRELLGSSEKKSFAYDGLSCGSIVVDELLNRAQLSCWAVLNSNTIVNWSSDAWQKLDSLLGADFDVKFVLLGDCQLPEEVGRMSNLQSRIVINTKPTPPLSPFILVDNKYIQVNGTQTKNLYLVINDAEFAATLSDIVNTLWDLNGGDNKGV